MKIVDNLNIFDNIVNIYYHPNLNNTEFNIAWQIRNPESIYSGLLYYDFKTNKVSYPPHATIPIQTEKDKEIIPKFVIIGVDSMSNELKNRLIFKMECGFQYRNGKKYEKYLD